MNFKNMAAGLCAAVMALTMLPAMPIEVQAAETPVEKVYTDYENSSQFPHATGSPMELESFKRKCEWLSDNITFSKEPYPGSGGEPLNKDKTVYAIISGQNATIYSKDGGGVFAPNNSKHLFFGFKALNIDVSGLDTSNVTNMNEMFSCSSAINLDLSSFDTRKVKDMGQMFFLSSAKTIDLSNFEVVHIFYPYMRGMFAESKVTSVLCRSEEDMNKMKNLSNREVLDRVDFKVKDNSIITNTVPINKANFPDDNFRNWILTNVDGKNGAAVMFRAAVPTTKDGLLDNKEQQATGTIDVNTQGIKDLRGIEHFPNLKTLNASNNDLSELNVSNNTKLESVDVTNNPNLNKVQANEKLDGKLNATVDQDTIVEYVPPFTKKNSGEGNNVPVTLKTVAHNFSVTVPTSLPIAVAADGTVTCAQSSVAAIVNNTEGPVEVTNVTLTGAAGWEIVPPTTAMESEAVNAKKLAMTIMGYETNAGGLDISAGGLPTLNGNASHPVEYTAKLPTQTIELNGSTVANVVFTIGWHEAA